MMDWTDRHCRFFHRLLTRRARLYTGDGDDRGAAARRCAAPSEHCPNCGGELKIIAAIAAIAAILEAPVIERILTHLGLQARARPRAPARGQTLLQAP